MALLETHGHAVTVVGNGRDALAAVESQPPDVVLMDVQMPEMDGLAATTAIRARERVRGGHVPIVGMTAHALPGDRETCLEAGMDQYVAKPVRAEQLFAAIEAAMPKSAAPSPRPGASLPQGGGVDWSAALRAVQDDPALLATVVRAALEELPRLLLSVQRAVTDGNPSDLRLSAHTLKGSLRCFGAALAAEQAQRLEQMGHAGDLQGAAEALRMLDARTQEVIRCLSEFSPR